MFSEYWCLFNSTTFVRTVSNSFIKQHNKDLLINAFYKRCHYQQPLPSCYIIINKSKHQYERTEYEPLVTYFGIGSQRQPATYISLYFPDRSSDPSPNCQHVSLTSTVSKIKITPRDVAPLDNISDHFAENKLLIWIRISLELLILIIKLPQFLYDQNMLNLLTFLKFCGIVCLSYKVRTFVSFHHFIALQVAWLMLALKGF